MTVAWILGIWVAASFTLAGVWIAVVTANNLVVKLVRWRDDRRRRRDHARLFAQWSELQMLEELWALPARVPWERWTR